MLRSIMKVVIVTSDYPLGTKGIIGGVQGVSFYLVRALKEIGGIDIEVIVPNAEQYGFKSCELIYVDGIKIHILTAEGNWPHYFKLFWQIPKILADKISSIDFDIIHFQANATFALLTNRPCVLTIHGINEIDTLYRGSQIFAKIKSFAIKITEGRARKKVSNVIAINPYVSKFLSANNKQVIWNIPNPVDDAFFEIKNIKINGRILCPATIMPRKNQLNLIHSFAKILNTHPYAELRFAGDGIDSEYGRKCLSLVQTLNIESKVFFLGPLNIDQVKNELSKAHFVALTSLHETAPLVISEAMAAGVPVLASNICGIPWMVNNGVTGFLVNPMDIDDIYNAALRILSNEKISSMQYESKQHALQSYKASCVAARTLEVYEKIAR